MAAHQRKKLANSRRELQRGRRKKNRKVVATWLLKIVMAIFFIGVAYWLWLSMGLVTGYWRQELSRRQICTVKEVIVSGNFKTAKEDIVHQLGVEPEMLLFDADLQEMQTAVEKLPYVETAQIGRQWPDRLVVSVTEREPVAMINLEKLYYVDRLGKVFKAVEPGDEVDFPVFTGLSADFLKKNPLRGRELLDLGLKLLFLWEADDVCCQEEVAEINLDDVMGLTVFTRRHVWQIMLGQEQFSSRLRHWQKVVAYLGEESRKVKKFDCRSNDRVVVGYKIEDR